eukprot:jgi/Mesen1/4376/ME000221S03494
MFEKSNQKWATIRWFFKGCDIKVPLPRDHEDKEVYLAVGNQPVEGVFNKQEWVTPKWPVEAARQAQVPDVVDTGQPSVGGTVVPSIAPQATYEGGNSAHGFAPFNGVLVELGGRNSVRAYGAGEPSAAGRTTAIRAEGASAAADRALQEEEECLPQEIEIGQEGERSLLSKTPGIRHHSAAAGGNSLPHHVNPAKPGASLLKKKKKKLLIPGSSSEHEGAHVRFGGKRQNVSGSARGTSGSAGHALAGEPAATTAINMLPTAHPPVLSKKIRILSPPRLGGGTEAGASCSPWPNDGVSQQNQEAAKYLGAAKSSLEWGPLKRRLESAQEPGGDRGSKRARTLGSTDGADQMPGSGSEAHAPARSAQVACVLPPTGIGHFGGTQSPREPLMVGPEALERRKLGLDWGVGTPRAPRSQNGFASAPASAPPKAGGQKQGMAGAARAAPSAVRLSWEKKLRTIGVAPKKKQRVVDSLAPERVRPVTGSQSQQAGKGGATALPTAVVGARPSQQSQGGIIFPKEAAADLSAPQGGKHQVQVQVGRGKEASLKERDDGQAGRPSAAAPVPALPPLPSSPGLMAALHSEIQGSIGIKLGQQGLQEHIGSLLDRSTSGPAGHAVGGAERTLKRSSENDAAGPSVPLALAPFPPARGNVLGRSQSCKGVGVRVDPSPRRGPQKDLGAPAIAPSALARASSDSKLFQPKAAEVGLGPEGKTAAPGSSFSRGGLTAGSLRRASFPADQGQARAVAEEGAAVPPRLALRPIATSLPPQSETQFHPAAGLQSCRGGRAAEHVEHEGTAVAPQAVGKAVAAPAATEEGIVHAPIAIQDKEEQQQQASPAIAASPTAGPTSPLTSGPAACQVDTPIREAIMAMLAKIPPEAIAEFQKLAREDPRAGHLGTGTDRATETRAVVVSASHADVAAAGGADVAAVRRPLSPAFHSSSELAPPAADVSVVEPQQQQQQHRRSIFTWESRLLKALEQQRVLQLSNLDSLLTSSALQNALDQVCSGVVEARIISHRAAWQPDSSKPCPCCCLTIFLNLYLLFIPSAPAGSLSFPFLPSTPPFQKEDNGCRSPVLGFNCSSLTCSWF